MIPRKSLMVFGMPSRKANVLHVCETGGAGGAETVLFNIVNNLDRLKYNSYAAIFRTGWLHQKLADNNIKTFLLKSTRPFDVGLLVRMRKTIKKNNIDLVHSHLPDANTYSCIAAATAGVPIIATYHGQIGKSGKKIDIGNLKLRIVRRFAAKVVTVSDYLKNELIQMAGFPSQRIHTIYNGIDFSRFNHDVDINEKKRELGLNRSDKLVGMVGNIRPTKGYEYYIRAAAIITKKIENVKFLIIGDGPPYLKEKVINEINNLGLSDRVLMLGFREDVPELLKILDVFVLSSISEGLSIATIEAMGAYVPVVATDCGGPREIIENEKNGFLVPSENEEKLAEKITLILEDRELSKSLSINAARHVRERFNIERMIDNYQRLYDECLQLN